MREKKFLHTRQNIGAYFSRNKYNIFTDETTEVKNTNTSTAPPKSNCILDVSKLPKKSSPRKWEEFYTNGRSEFHTSCTVLCSALIVEPPYYFWKENHDNPDAHAVIRTLQSVTAKEEKLHSSARYITLYLSYSPCGNCAESIISFLEARPTCKISVYFTCIYRHDKEREHRDGLRKLYFCSGVKELRVFTDKEWQELASKCGVQYVQDDVLRNYFDSYWKKEYTNILRNKENDGQVWKSAQLPPRIQYLEDGGDPALIHFETQINIDDRSEARSRRSKRFVTVVDPRKNKLSASAIVITIIVIIFIAAIINGWRSTEESAEQLQNVTESRPA